MVKFKNLWDSYPDEPPCSKKDFSDQCAIKVGNALAKCGVKTITLVKRTRHCWHHEVGEGHTLAAEELAAGLAKVRIQGISSAVEIKPENFKSQLTGKKGIVFFKDYWLRSADKPGRPTGDHIDLWNGSRLTDWRTWVRIQFGLVIPGVWSDLEKSKKILFWKVLE
ncbi:T6SS effector amidase Tae4 family protein [Teredinibacter waterburyi]|jgi:hypothetical protein|uniref:T6SS effector amidase Tae4 family protein n=1 Tax=Teredinibacter waterburyi TaxID=1500538 RepID=UPI00165F79D6|nr:T6SS effector amidase Tae4 family protein [Teredinibacter waterburyi]